VSLVGGGGGGGAVLGWSAGFGVLVRAESRKGQVRSSRSRCKWIPGYLEGRGRGERFRLGWVGLRRCLLVQSDRVHHARASAAAMTPPARTDMHRLSVNHEAVALLAKHQHHQPRRPGRTLTTFAPHEKLQGLFFHPPTALDKSHQPTTYPHKPQQHHGGLVRVLHQQRLR
jgi:hypothetical protein